MTSLNFQILKSSSTNNSQNPPNFLQTFNKTTIQSKLNTIITISWQMNAQRNEWKRVKGRKWYFWKCLSSEMNPYSRYQHSGRKKRKKKLLNINLHCLFYYTNISWRHFSSFSLKGQLTCWQNVNWREIEVDVERESKLIESVKGNGRAHKTIRNRLNC